MGWSKKRCKTAIVNAMNAEDRAARQGDKGKTMDKSHGYSGGGHAEVWCNRRVTQILTCYQPVMQTSIPHHSCQLRTGKLGYNSHELI